jgi:hypothetical protein
MVVVGSETVYLSHLPMSMKPHDFQVLLQAGPPDFDQLVSVAVADDAFTAPALAAGIPVTVPGRKSLAAERVGLDGRDPSVAASATVGGNAVPVELRPQVEFYVNDNADLQ